MRKIRVISKKEKLFGKQRTKKELDKIFDLSKLNHYKIFFKNKKSFVVLSEEMAFVSRWILKPYKNKGYRIKFSRTRPFILKLAMKNHKSRNKPLRRKGPLTRKIYLKNKLIDQILIVKLTAEPVNIKDLTKPYAIL